MKSFRPSSLALGLLGVLLLLICSNVNWGKERWKNILEADAKGYYAYLPALFIYQDLNFGFFEALEGEKYYDPNLYYDYRIEVNGKTSNKYYAGTALAQSPFFIMAHLMTLVSGGEADGYSRLYPMFINVAAVFYTLLGLFFLRLWVARMRPGEWTLIAVFIALIFGTNLFYYLLSEPGMSHVYSFAFVSGFLWAGDRYFNQPGWRRLCLVALFWGMLVLIRPVNGLVILLLPFLAGSRSTFLTGISWLFKRPGAMLTGLVIFLVFPAIQLFLYRISVDTFWVYSYGEEGFIWTDPHLIDILFSYKKGLFVYTPMYLLGLVAGGWALYRHNRFQAATLFLFWCVLTYVLSSWWMWYYGGSFSSRVYVEYLPIIGFLFVLALTQSSRLKKRVWLGGMLALIIVCQIQTYQYRYYHIHWSDMTKEKYWEVFLRVDRLME